MRRRAWFKLLRCRFTQMALSGHYLGNVPQFMQGCCGRGRWRVALLQEVREVTEVTVIPKAVTLGGNAFSPLASLEHGRANETGVKCARARVCVCA